MVTIIIQKKHLFLISAIIVFFVGVGIIISYGDFSSGNPAVVGHSSDEVDVKVPDRVSGNVKNLQKAIDDGDIGKTKTAFFSITINSIIDYDIEPIGFIPKYAEVSCRGSAYNPSTGITTVYRIDGDAVGNETGLIKQFSNAYKFGSSGTTSYSSSDKFIAAGPGMSGQITQWSKDRIKISVSPGPSSALEWYSSLDCNIIVLGN